MAMADHIEQPIAGNNNQRRPIGRWIVANICIVNIMMASCSGDTESGVNNNNTGINLQEELRNLMVEQGGGLGLDAFLLPDSDDLSAIPQDPNNPLTSEKVALGRLLFHDTAFALNGFSPDETGSWSCATCHHAAAGFKSGIPQGIGEGGIGFGHGGTDRALSIGFDVNAEAGASNLPDVQPLTSPTILNSAFQDVMLWNGQFGNAEAGSANTGLPESVLLTPDTPKAENSRQLSGLETQAIAGIGVHRLKMSPDTPLQNNGIYRALWEDVFGNNSSDALADAGKSIAAYERTVLSNKAPFQQWLRGDDNALSEDELKGALLFFGKAGCVQCHRGPALSSEPGATDESLFFAVGFSDFEQDDDRVHIVDNSTPQLGRAEFTQRNEDRFKFKIPPLYNLADTDVFGHGASFNSVEEVLDYKNAGVAQNLASIGNLDSRFSPLDLDEQEIMNLSDFLTQSLYDPDLQRYQPETVPSGSRVVVDSFELCAVVDIDCEDDRQ